MMKRDMSTTILGRLVKYIHIMALWFMIAFRPIIQLPEPHAEVRLVEFSAEEKAMYDITEARFHALLNQNLQKGDPRRSYTS